MPPAKSTPNVEFRIKLQQQIVASHVGLPTLDDAPVCGCLPGAVHAFVIGRLQFLLARTLAYPGLGGVSPGRSGYSRPGLISFSAPSAAGC
jgi:hypothetical protein